MHKNAQKFEQLRTKFPSTTLGYPLVRISRLDDAFSGILQLEASSVEGQQLQQKDKKKEKGKAREKINAGLFPRKDRLNIKCLCAFSSLPSDIINNLILNVPKNGILVPFFPILDLICVCMHSYVARLYSYVPRMYSYFPRLSLVCYSHVTRMYSYVTRTYSYVLVWCFGHDHVFTKKAQVLGRVMKQGNVPNSAYFMASYKPNTLIDCLKPNLNKCKVSLIPQFLR